MKNDPKKDLETAIHILNNRGEFIRKVAIAEGISDEEAKDLVNSKFPIDRHTLEFLEDMDKEVEVWIASEEKQQATIQ